MTKSTYPSTASVLIEGLTELDLVNSVNGQQHAHHQQLPGDQSVSPLIVVNCNNSLSSNNSNFTDDTVVTYQQHQNNNSINLTGRFFRVSSRIFFRVSLKCKRRESIKTTHRTSFTLPCRSECSLPISNCDESVFATVQMLADRRRSAQRRTADRI